MHPHDVSPTGAPVISPKVVPYLAGLVAVAAAVAAKMPDIVPSSELDQQIAGIIVALGTIFGIASPGWRKQG